MEVEVPPTAARVSLVRASTTTLEVCWSTTPTAQAYLLEVQKIEQPPQPSPIPVTITKKQHVPINASAITASANEGIAYKRKLHFIFLFTFIYSDDFFRCYIYQS